MIRAITIARFSEQKRLDIAIKAVKILRQAGMPVTLQILGADPENAELSALIAREGVEDAIYPVGFSENPEAYLRTADVYLQSSDWEPLGMAILEALQLGKRVVSTDCAGPVELLRNNVGWLAPRGDPGLFALTVMDALRAPAFDPLRQQRALEYSLSTGMPALLSILRSRS